MDNILQLIHIVLHLNLYLGNLINQYGAWTFALLFLIIFCETGLVITPFLPGDSLLFACGAIFASSQLNIGLLVMVLIVAAFLGDNCNYWIGRYLGPKVFKEHARIFKPVYRENTQIFYKKYGGKAIIIARFLPILRTFVPFFAGISKMYYPKYLAYSISSAILWISLLTYAGYWFGNIPLVKNNFSIVITAIILLSLVPAAYSLLRKHLSKK
ncbi:MAG: DedA family rane protein [Gammaproteobacteria bacterium]|jgi:membrane-associated protein|nr:DedA family rane protein [Gammaproteobacteria bacterium]